MFTNANIITNSKKVSQLDRVRNKHELLERTEEWKIKLQWLERYCKVNNTCSFVLNDVKKPNVIRKNYFKTDKKLCRVDIIDCSSKPYDDLGFRIVRMY